MAEKKEVGGGGTRTYGKTPNSFFYKRIALVSNFPRKSKILFHSRAKHFAQVFKILILSILAKVLREMVKSGERN